MIVTRRPNRLPRLSLLGRLLFWGPLFLLLVAGAFLKVRHEAGVTHAREEFLREKPGKDIAAAAALERVQALYRSRKRPNYFTLADLEQELNGGRPIERSSDARAGTHQWTDSESGRVFYLRIGRERRSDLEESWTGFNTGWPNGDDPPTPPPKALVAVEPLRQAVAHRHGGWGPLLWGCLLVPLVAVRRWRAVTSEVSLAIAVLTTASLLLSPNYPLSVASLTSNDPLVWAVPMLVASGVLLWWSCRITDTLDPGLCPTCGYDVRATPERCPECGTVAAASPAVPPG